MVFVPIFVVVTLWKKYKSCHRGSTFLKAYTHIKITIVIYNKY